MTSDSGGFRPITEDDLASAATAAQYAMRPDLMRALRRSIAALTTPEAEAQRLRERFTAEQIAALITALTREEG